MISNNQTIIAIIDDDAGMREAAESLLSACGYVTETFKSAEAFLSVAATCEAACLVVDIQLGDGSGLELARQLIADGYKYRIVFMTGHDNEKVRNQAAAVGGVDFLCKPFPAKMLLDAVKKALRQSCQ